MLPITDYNEARHSLIKGALFQSLSKDPIGIVCDYASNFDFLLTFKPDSSVPLQDKVKILSCEYTRLKEMISFFETLPKRIVEQLLPLHPIAIKELPFKYISIQLLINKASFLLDIKSSLAACAKGEIPALSDFSPCRVYILVCLSYSEGITSQSIPPNLLHFFNISKLFKQVHFHILQQIKEEPLEKSEKDYIEVCSRATSERLSNYLLSNQENWLKTCRALYEEESKEAQGNKELQPASLWKKPFEEFLQTVSLEEGLHILHYFNHLNFTHYAKTRIKLTIVAINVLFSRFTSPSERAYLFTPTWESYTPAKGEVGRCENLLNRPFLHFMVHLLNRGLPLGSINREGTTVFSNFAKDKPTSPEMNYHVMTSQFFCVDATAEIKAITYADAKEMVKKISEVGCEIGEDYSIRGLAPYAHAGKIYLVESTDRSKKFLSPASVFHLFSHIFSLYKKEANLDALAQLHAPAFKELSAAFVFIGKVYQSLFTTKAKEAWDGLWGEISDTASSIGVITSKMEDKSK